MPTHARPAGKEGDLVRAVIQYINARGGMATRMNSGRTVIRSGGKTRAIHMGAKGWPDVIGVWPIVTHCEPKPISAFVSEWVPRHMGRLIAVECKRRGNKVTREQEFMLTELRKRGALTLVIHSIDELQRALDAG